MKNICSLSVLIALAGFASCRNPSKPTVPVAAKSKAEEMKARFTILNKCYSNNETNAIDTLVVADVINHVEDSSLQLPKGREGLKQMIAMTHDGSPDVQSEIKFMAVDGDILIAYCTLKGTNTNASMGMPATNKAWSADYTDVIKFNSDLKMTEHWGVFDNLKLMTDLGWELKPAHAKLSKAEKVK